MYRKCQDRAIWLRLLRTLDVQLAPNLPPGIPVTSLPASDLKAIVVSAHRADYRWRTEGRLHVGRRVEMQVDYPATGRPVGRPEPRLLPGAREALLICGGRLELWELETRVCVWTAPDREAGYDCVSFDFEVAEDGRTMNIAGIFVVGEALDV